MTSYMTKMSRIIITAFILFSVSHTTFGQVNSVNFGRNRVQHRIFKWQYYQTKNFNVYFYDGGQELAKYALQEAEKQLPQIEAAAEYSLQRRANILVYNSFADYKQTNVGLDASPINTGNVTTLVNNKMLVYFDGNHANLKRQLRQGIAGVITRNVLFGDDLGEIAGNQALLVLPDWLTQGYIAYLGENWSTQLDDELKNEILSGNFTKFSSLARYKPQLAGHAFWYFIEEKYKKENVTYFLYLARIYRNVNKASMQITKQSFKSLLREFMAYSEEKFYEDIKRRRAYPKGSYIESFPVNKRLNYYHFNVNPIKRNNSYVVTEFKRGQVRVILNEDFSNKVLLKYGVRNYESRIDKNMPLMAWDGKGTRIAVVYVDEGKLKLFVYDVVNRFKPVKIDLSEKFEQVQDIKFMLDSRNVLLSAVKDGHTDIFTMDVDKETVRRITNDVYDDVDASLVAFPGKTGILFSSNRPSATATSSDTVLPADRRHNIFLITDFGDKPELNQISQLSNLQYGDARMPTQYNANHFTFVSDENGIANRYAGFFTSVKEGLDTLVIIDGEILRNPSAAEVDSTLKVYKKTDVDSVAVVSISSDSVYSFPLTNYPSSLAESRIAGDNNQVSEVTQQSDEKILYKLKIDDNVLKRRNITAVPTAYSKKLRRESRFTNVNEANKNKDKTISPRNQDDFFQTEFDTKDSIPKTTDPNVEGAGETYDALASAKLYPYKPKKFSIDYGGAGFNNTVLVNRYQAYQGGAGPVRLNGSSSLNGLIKIGTSDLFEDIRITGAYKIGNGLKDNEWYVNYQNLRRRPDWGGSYYRNVQSVGIQLVDNSGAVVGLINGKNFTNLYQINVSYPLNEVKRISLTTGYRRDKLEYLTSGDVFSLQLQPSAQNYSMSELEFVHDNTLNPQKNIWEGLRYKAYFNYNAQVGKKETALGRSTYVLGFDARHYYPIFRNLTWAVRAAGDFSFGNQKLIYYLGGTDGWFIFNNNIKRDGSFRYFNTSNQPLQNQGYAFQSLAVNMRGFIQNLANGNNATVINSEIRLPVVSTLFDKVSNNAFMQDLQLVQFIDLGTAWAGGIQNIKRPQQTFNTPIGTTPPLPGPTTVNIKTGGIGPFAGGYGFGIRSTLLGYFMKYDVSWPMNVFFRGKPQMYLSMGLDF